MLIEGLTMMTLLTANPHQGDLDIRVDDEDQQNVNKDIKEYDTTLFDDESKKINQRIKEHQQNKDSNIKNNLFQKQAGNKSRLDETKHVLFSNKNLNKTAESDKSPYLQDKQKKNFFPYILLSIGAFLTIGFMVFTIQRGRRVKR
ncbi:type VII secretion protein EssA [Staphylococcus sp. HMSC062A05]|uniref:type VII secretion protein EssA n=1 Tax=Staphylococcus sp. HMSC062A05 TaxID=1715061 RepID=UPI0008A90A1D|nr:type VII secretion protein EssA [Staphylococcus sp. HMSC062A05]OHP70624.1 type VII secretion protein EssA [Staphylococcus sp. HMSC062A05]